MFVKHYGRYRIEGHFTFKQVANITLLANQLSRGSATQLGSVIVSPTAEASGTAQELMRSAKCR
jgi:hypothetical protein